MSHNGYLVRINKVNKRLRRSLWVLQLSVLIIFGIVVYYFLSLIPENVFSVWNLILVIRVLKEIIVLAMVVTLYFIIFQSVKEIKYGISAKVYVIVFLSNIATIFGVDPSFMLNANYFYNHIVNSLSQPLNFIFGLTFLVFIISSILILGFIRRGSLELLFTLLIIMYLDLIFLALFTQIFRLEGLSQIDLTNISSIIRVLLSREILFFVLSFILVEFGQIYAFFYSYARPLSDRLERLVAQLERVERAVGEERVRRRARTVEEMKVREVLSPLARSIIKDAFEGYAFLGEGTSLFISAKLKSYVRRMSEKVNNYFESIAGVLATPKVSTIIGSLILSFLTKVASGLLIVVGSAYILLFVLNRLGGGTIIEMGRIEAYIYVNIALISLVYIIVLILSYRLKLSKREEVREIS